MSKYNFSTIMYRHYTPVFEMLSHWSKEVKEEWRRFLHRDDAWELAKVFICLKHFSDNDVLLHFDIPMGDGTVKKVPRKPGLRKNDIDEIQRKYSTLNLSEKWMYIRSSQTTLHIFKKLQSGPLLTMSHQIYVY